MIRLRRRHRDLHLHANPYNFTPEQNSAWLDAICALQRFKADQADVVPNPSRNTHP